MDDRPIRGLRRELPPRPISPVPPSLRSAMKNEPQSRRSFVTNMAGAAMSFTIVPRHVLGRPGYIAPSDTVNFATIGSGLRGTQDTTDALLVGQNFVALVDVNLRGVENRIAPTTTGPQAVPAALAAARR